MSDNTVKLFDERKQDTYELIKKLHDAKDATSIYRIMALLMILYRGFDNNPVIIDKELSFFDDPFDIEKEIYNVDYAEARKNAISETTTNDKKKIKQLFDSQTIFLLMKYLFEERKTKYLKYIKDDENDGFTKNVEGNHEKIATLI